MANVLIVLYFFLKAKKAPPNNNKHVFWWFMMTTDFKATELCQHWCVQLWGQHQNYKHRYLSQLFSPALDRDMIVFGDVNIERCCCYRHGVVFAGVIPVYLFCRAALLLSLTNSTYFEFYFLSFICYLFFKVRVPWFCPWQTAPTLTLAARRFATYWSRQNQVNTFTMMYDHCF